MGSFGSNFGRNFDIACDVGHGQFGGNFGINFDVCMADIDLPFVKTVTGCSNMAVTVNGDSKFCITIDSESSV